ncbi:MAG TPA: hypothetical protein DD706_07150 [Nitrospiraceae bacterium]|nr:hypothetical protein [Nitrospiraceae bacterium]
MLALAAGGASTLVFATGVSVTSMGGMVAVLPRMITISLMLAGVSGLRSHWKTHESCGSNDLIDGTTAITCMILDIGN